MGAKRKEKKLKAITLNLSPDMKIWSAKIEGEIPTPKIRIFIEAEFGWASGEMRWCVIITKDGEIAAKYPHTTEKEARIYAIEMCALAEHYGRAYETDLKLGDSPKKDSQ